MALDERYHCRVCGLWRPDPPWGLGGRTPLYEFCPCCGVEFGYQDASVDGVKLFRKNWLASGAEWLEAESRPSKWNLEQQLGFVPKAYR
jgi:hypothetical protein